MDKLPPVLMREPITYRQMQHWLDSYPEMFSRHAVKPGTGHARELTIMDVDRLRIMARLVNVGFRPAAAAALATQRGFGSHQLSHHVQVVINP